MIPAIVAIIGRKSVLTPRLFVLKNVVTLNYSLEKVYFCTQTNMRYDAEKKN